MPLLSLIQHDSKFIQRLTYIQNIFLLIKLTKDGYFNRTGSAFWHCITLVATHMGLINRINGYGAALFQRFGIVTVREETATYIFVIFLPL